MKFQNDWKFRWNRDSFREAQWKFTFASKSFCANLARVRYDDANNECNKHVHFTSFILMYYFRIGSRRLINSALNYLLQRDRAQGFSMDFDQRITLSLDNIDKNTFAPIHFHFLFSFFCYSKKLFERWKSCIASYNFFLPRFEKFYISCIYFIKRCIQSILVIGTNWNIPSEFPSLCLSS